MYHSIEENDVNLRISSTSLPTKTLLTSDYVFLESRQDWSGELFRWPVLDVTYSIVVFCRVVLHRIYRMRYAIGPGYISMSVKDRKKTVEVE